MRAWTRGRSVLTIAIALAAAFVPSSVGLEESEAASQSCGFDQVQRIVGGKKRCISVWKLLRRSLYVPVVPAGSACPTSTASGLLRKLDPGLTGAAFGPGPAYPHLGGDEARVGFAYPIPPNSQYAGTGWGATKVIWFVKPGQNGAILIRGRQLDGPNPLRFENGSPRFTSEAIRNPAPELRIRGGGGHPAITRFREPGCYAYQVDSINFSYLVFFEAVGVAEQ